MKTKKAQITIFVILAIVVVTGLLLFFLARDNFNLLGVNSEIRPIHNFVQECVKKTANDAIYHIGETGGYFISPNNSLENNVNIYFDVGENLVPSLETIEKEITKYMDSMLFFCVKNFISFPDFEIEQGGIKNEVKIEEGKVVFNIDYPLSIKKGDSTYSIDKFDLEINSRLFTIQKATNQLTEYQKETPEALCLSCIEEVSADNDLYIIMMNYGYDGDVVIFEIIDINSKINNEDYRFYFANRYGGLI